MAYGFRHIPKQRKASDYDLLHCPNCRARFDLGPRPHLCKENTPGTTVAPTRIIPFDAAAVAP